MYAVGSKARNMSKLIQSSLSQCTINESPDMNTLPSTRSVNTFRSEENRSSSINNLRYPRPSSLYLPMNDRDDDGREHLLPNDPFSMERRAQTLGRPTHYNTSGNRNLTNPLFESVGSLDQPWYKSYAATSTLPQPTISLPPNRPQEINTFATARELHSTVRVPVPRSPARPSPYSTIRRLNEPSLHSYRTTRATKAPPLFSCAGSKCCEREPSPYATPADLESSDHFIRHKKKDPPKPWVVCLLTVSTIFDLLLLIAMAVVVFFLNCSTESWLYSDRRIYTICTNLWTDWIPLHHRTFRCPALPPGYDDSSLASANPLLKQYIERFRPTVYTTPAYGSRTDNLEQPKNPFLTETIGGLFPRPDVWDADLGLMPPPNLNPAREDPMYGMTTTRLYGPTYEREQTSWLRNREHWLRINPAAPYTSIPTDSIILGCTIIPLIMIVFIEITSSCLSCCWLSSGKVGHRFGQLRRVIGRLYRFCVTYIFGLFTVILITLILKAAIGRLRPNFITICRPAPNVCPRWSALIQAAGYGYYNQEATNDLGSNPQLLSFLAQESARQGYILVPKTTTPNPAVRTSKSDSGFLSDTDCTEKRPLRIKYARTSFPSLGASVTMYAAVFVSAYVTHTLRYLRRTCLCIPLVLLLATFLANILLGLGRVVHRENWIDDVLAGWALGIIVAAYIVSHLISVLLFQTSVGRNYVSHLQTVGLHNCFHNMESYKLYRTLHATQTWNSVSNADILHQLDHIQDLIRANQEYKNNE
ncbi:PAP2 family protein, partial [Opisthorchis viverrini]